MQPGRASATAEGAALLRAAHQLFDEPRILDDPVVLPLLGPDAAALVQANREALESPVRRRLRAAIVLRSRFAEDCLLEAVGRGVRQYVILGAGLDSFAYRNPCTPDALRVYEVDHPDTQARKRERLHAAGIALPVALTFVPADLEREPPAAALARNGFDPALPTFVSWLGVTVYLGRDAVLDTLSWAAGLAPGSEIVFSYVAEPASLGAAERAALDALARRTAEAGEPWRTFFAPAALARELGRLGFTDVDDLGPAQAFARYFRDRRDGLRPGGAAHLMRARLPIDLEGSWKR
ncbi:MAG TPA: class I SAM-dependent methyltransferase [Candidatus Binatia bacterium]|nr:class I SAM-dependent methyltransferase [Candidatus Binatia bacterium]